MCIYDTILMGFKGLKRVVAKEDGVGTAFNRVEDIETDEKPDIYRMDK